MAYDTANPPSLRDQDIGNQGVARYTYTSADPAATVAGAGYISNGYYLGLKVNDIVEVVDTATPLVTTHRVESVDTTTGAVTLSAGTTIGATT